MVLAGAGLFLTGTVLGGILTLTVLLYREPAGPLPASAVPEAFSMGTGQEGLAGSGSMSIDRAATSTPLPTPSARPIGPKVGWEAPAFALPDLDGAEHSLAAYRGRIVLLHFWASWCLPCRAEWPALRAFVGQQDGSEVVLLAVNSEEPLEVVRNFVGPDLPPFPVLLDSGDVGRAYRLSALPTTFGIGPDGIVRCVVPGNIGVEGLKGLIERQRP